MSATSILLVLAASLALLPLAMAPGVLFYFDVTPKIAVLLIATAIALLFAKGNAEGLRTLQATRQGRLLTYLIAGQALSLFISTAFSQDIALSITGSAWRRCGAIVELSILVFTLLLATRAAAVPEGTRSVLRFITVSCLVTAIYGIGQFFGFDPVLPAHVYHAGEGIWTIVRPPSTLGNANFFANYLVYASVCSAALVSWKTGSAWNWIGAAACGLGTIAIILSGTRSGILGLSVGAVVLLAGSASRQRYWIAGSATGAMALICLLMISPLGQPVRARVRWSREDVLGGGRLLLWRDAARMAAARPITGFGPDQFGRSFPGHQSLELARVHPDFYQESPHNGLLDAANSAGVPGLILSIAMLVLGFYAAWQMRMSEPRLALYLAAALAGGTVCGMFSPPMVVTKVYQMALIAILCGSGGRPFPASAESRTSILAWARVVCWSTAAGFLIFAGALVVSDVLAGLFKRSVEVGDVEHAVHRYRTARKYSVPGFAIDLYASRALMQLSMREAAPAQRVIAWQEAMYAGQLAVETAEDRQNAFFHLAQLYARQDDAGRTEQSLRSAARIAPNWFKPHWILAELLIRTGRAPEARDEARTAMSADAGKDPEVVRTWRALGSPR